MNLEDKLKRIQTLQYIVASRWLLHAGIVALGIVQKVIDVAEFDFRIFGLLFVTYSYNFAYYLYLKRDPVNISRRGLSIVSVLQVVLDQLVYTLVLYTTGGVESLSFLFYFFTIFIAIILFREFQIILFSIFTIALYIGVIVLEYYAILPHYNRFYFDPGFYGNFGVTSNNVVTVVFILTFTSFFAAFISNLIRSRESGIASERDKIAAIIDNLVDGIIMLDREGHILLMNPYAQRVLQVRLNQVGSGILKPHDFSTSLQPLIHFITETGDDTVYRSEEIDIIEEDDRIVLQATALQMADSRGYTIGSLIILHNITREKDLDQMKSDFISVAAHQLRTPLATLKWLFKIMLDGDTGKLSDKQHDLLDKGFKRNNEVIEIVNSLLDVSEIEEGRFPYKFSEGSMSDTVNQVIEESAVHAERMNITLVNKVTAGIDHMNFDRQKIKIAIRNLIDNAIKYSHESGAVKIMLSKEEDNVIIKVVDGGIGMSDETQEKLFTKFFRGKEAAMKDPTGSGLGLYIVRSISEHHGGRIKFDSKLGEGTTFTITIPLTID
ncbi:MAG: ATP-binding protein [bacterium]|nr:ATP-binding protein [bacterium]